jgi:hypothetical protein
MSLYNPSPLCLLRLLRFCAWRKIGKPDDWVLAIHWPGRNADLQMEVRTGIY